MSDPHFDDDKFEKLALWVFTIVIVLGLAMFVLGSWGFVEIVRWLTSK